ncbi:MAG: thrombospondin type 3 repeat-containing protein [Gammaproteobacteria bacterium]
MSKTRKRQAIALCAVGTFCINTPHATPPEYEIVSLGIVDEEFSGAQAISEDGRFVTGFTGNSAFIRRGTGSSVELPSLGLRQVFFDDFESYLPGDSLDTDNPASPYNSSTSEATVGVESGPGMPGNQIAQIIDTDPGDTGELRYALGNDGPLSAGRLDVAVKRLDDTLGNADAFISLLNENNNNDGAILDFRIRDDSFAVRSPITLDTSTLPHTLDAFMNVQIIWEYPDGDTNQLPLVTLSVDGVSLAPFTPENNAFGGVTHVRFRFGDNSGVREPTGIYSVDELAIYSGENATRPFSTPWAVNNSGIVAGIGATTFFGSDALPVYWIGSTAAPLPLPDGETLGRAYGINNSALAVGSVNGGSLERAATFQVSGTGTILAQTLAGGVLTTAYDINDAGRIVGTALDPANAAVTKGFYLDSGDSEATDLGALTSLGHNSAIAFDVSSNGLVAGSSSFNSGVDGRAFLWSEVAGMTAVPLPAGTSTAGGRGVNASGWVVGTASSAFAVPFLYDGTATYRLQDLITTGGDGWALQTGTSNGAFSIADDGTIVGRGVLNGTLTAFAMVLIGSDTDEDGVSDASDNCTMVANAAQRDSDNDGHGNFCDADFNNDCIVNAVDLGQFRQVFFTADADADLNGDGAVNAADLGLLRVLFFEVPGPSAEGFCAAP